MNIDPNSARRIELILQQVDSLPTLPEIGLRLLQITSDDDSNASQVVDLIKSDPTLTARILTLARSAHHGVSSDLVTIDRAVVLLGFDAIRNAVLSIKVFETFAEDQDQESATHLVDAGFTTAAFWRHSLGVAIASELLARYHPQIQVKPDTAFVCGLLHDIGKLGMEHTLPKSYLRVIELTEQAQLNIADVERKVLGIDHHTAGKRLAERWQLPHILQDCIWLHGASFSSLPPLDHRMTVGLVGLADLIVRQQHIGYSGNHQFAETIEERVESMGLNLASVNEVMEQTIEELENRTETLGLGHVPSRRMFLESITRANGVLGKLNQKLHARRQASQGQLKALDAITRFHETWSSPGRSVQDVLGAAVVSAQSVFGDGFYAMIYQPRGETLWQISQFNREGTLTRGELIEPPPNFQSLNALNHDNLVSVDWMNILPWLSEYLVGTENLHNVKLLALPCGWGTAAVLLHDRPQLPASNQLQSLTLTWGTAIGAATQHEGARRLGEQLAQANQVLTETQHHLLKNESLVRLGEMAAGAAHEMNNPLMVISGRAQLLSMSLEDENQKEAASLIFQQSQKLSEMITAMHLFSESPNPNRQEVDIVEIIEQATELANQETPRANKPQVRLVGNLPKLWTDPNYLAESLSELVINAQQAEPIHQVQITAQVDLLSGRLNIKVVDDGAGMDAQTLHHAFDPFFSDKQAGRRIGLGLSRAKRLVEAMEGEIELSSTPGQGTTATISLPVDQNGNMAKDENEQSQSINQLHIGQ